MVFFIFHLCTYTFLIPFLFLFLFFFPPSLLLLFAFYLFSLCLCVSLSLSPSLLSVCLSVCLSVSLSLSLPLSLSLSFFTLSLSLSLAHSLALALCPDFQEIATRDDISRYASEFSAERLPFCCYIGAPCYAHHDPLQIRMGSYAWPTAATVVAVGLLASSPAAMWPG